jgi:hypothetical protein
MTEDEVTAYLNDSEDEDILEEIDEIPIRDKDLSSDEEETDENEEDAVENEDDVEEEPQPSTSKRPRTAPREWNNTDFTPEVHEFNSSHSGISPTLNLNENSTESDFFLAIMNEEIVNIIVKETNDYAATLCTSASTHSKLKKWVVTTAEEIYMFLATLLLMSLVGKNSLKKYWSTNPIIETPFFRVLFSQDRFFLLLRCLHFTDNSISSTDRLKKIRNILDPFKRILKSSFYPFEKLCIDESLLLWKGKLSFKIYIPSKRHRFGIKLFVCCDVATGYVLDFIVYTGADTDIVLYEGQGISGSVVLTMLKDYLGRGHKLYVDNWYTSPTLFDYLFSKKTNACGTVRANRKEMPKFPKIQKGEVRHFHSNGLLAIKWCDKRDIHILTTVNSHNMSLTNKIDYTTGQFKIKPDAVIDYSKNMGAVDKVDRILGFSEVSRKSLKWYKKVFFRIIDIASINAFFLFNSVSKKNPTNFSNFKENLIKQLVEKYHKSRPSTTGGRRVHDSPTRLCARFAHYMKPVPQVEGGKLKRKQCHVCKHTQLRQQKRKDSSWMCRECGVGLCMYPCFEEYHTKQKY